jgi:hypothetical protein
MSRRAARATIFRIAPILGAQDASGLPGWLHEIIRSGGRSAAAGLTYALSLKREGVRSIRGLCDSAETLKSRTTLLLLTALAIAMLVVPADALAVPPTLSTVGQENRHPTATFSAPRADLATIYIATKPDRATDGRFLDENVAAVDLLTDSELQAGRWMSESQLDPGSYWVMLNASPDFDACYIGGPTTYDPACADGFSNVQMLVVPEPTIRYAGGVTVYRFLRQASLRLTARPLGENRLYRVCYRLKSGRTRCLVGTLRGFDWNSSANDTLTVTTRGLPLRTTFSWFVGGKRVAVKTALIPR